MLGIRDNRLSTAKSQVTATRELRESFDAAVNFISQFLDVRRAFNAANANPPRNVALAHTERTGRGIMTVVVVVVDLAVVADSMEAVGTMEEVVLVVDSVQQAEHKMVDMAKCPINITLQKLGLISYPKNSSRVS